VYANFYAADFAPETNVVTLDGYIDETERENLILSANLVGEFATGSIEHTVIFGGEFINTESDQNRLNPVFDSNGDDQEDFLVSRPLNFRGLTER